MAAPDPGRWEQVAEAFRRATEAPESEREAALAAACGEDDGLRREVERLLEADASASAEHFFEGPGPLTLRSLLWDDPMVGRAIGPYELAERIGEGGMGSVYRAFRRDDPAQVVALKLIRPGLESQATVGRFRNERQVLAGLNHPRIAKVLGGGAAEDGRPYLVMEYIAGEPIDQYCRERGLTTATKIGLIREVCLAVEHAHQLGVVHRDLKPSNILVDGEGQVKVLDFGVARVRGDSLKSTTIETSVGRPVGTIRYMSPEQVTASPTLDGRSDIYALGVIAYEQVAGHSPYDLAGKGLAQAARIITEQEPMPLGEGLRGPLEAILGKALEKDPSRRYATMAAFAGDLERYLNREPIQARSRPFWERLARRFQRRPVRPAALAAAILGTALLTAGIVLGIASLWSRPIGGWPAALAALREARARWESDPGEESRGDLALRRLDAKIRLLQEVRGGGLGPSDLMEIAREADRIGEPELARLAREEADRTP
jgi:serine/threonine protein kinase